VVQKLYGKVIALKNFKHGQRSQSYQAIRRLHFASPMDSKGNLGPGSAAEAAREDKNSPPAYRFPVPKLIAMQG